jgi:hypothetical protein
MRLPDRRFTVALLRRALYLWIGVRLLVVLGGGGGAAEHGLLPLTPQTTTLVVLLVGFLGLLEARRRNEHVLLANFGVPQAGIAGLSVVPAIVAETVVWLVTRS